jgi:type II restriction/modification system DNA methylase subunit YeeA
MDTSKLKKFAQHARRYLMEQVAAKMKFVLSADSQARRENPKAVDDLERQIHVTSQQQIIEKVAYIWFNRFCAIRFMDANRYTRIGIVSPAEGQSQPEILAEAKMGHIDEDLMPDALRQKVFDLINGSMPSRDPQAEAYHLLVVASCNYYNRSMPFMFEKIADFTELLIPDDLLSGNSILADTREAMTPEVCKDVEVIGWLYQFYISEKKDEVFEGLKKNKKITPENIPAATQLFTPHWIVRYLVENSLGRLWMLNRPSSKLIAQMDYYIRPETPETDFLRISKPEDIKLCDPASGSGHMLTYSYDLLYTIYEEEGYDTNEIPRLILENNLFGIEIDERAGELAAFALSMKAAKGNPKGDTNNYRRFFRKPVLPNICVLQKILFDDGELKSYMDAVGRDLFTANLQTMLHQFREANNFGSLIRPEYADAASVLRKVEENNLTSDLFLQNTHGRVLLALKQADYLSPKYHVVVANPPYMDRYDDRLRNFANSSYPNSKANSYSMFIDRCLQLSLQRGTAALVTLQGWMFNSSYEKLRQFILKNSSIASMIHLGARAFDSIGGEVVSTTAFVISKSLNISRNATYISLVDGQNELEKDYILKEVVSNNKEDLKYLRSFSEFEKVPGAPIAYWASHALINTFSKFKGLGDSADPRSGMATGDNDRFLRYWSEVSQNKIGFGLKSRDDAQISRMFWFPYNKGGSIRKWYGNNEHLVLFYDDGKLIKDTKEKNLAAGRITANNSKCWNQECYFLPCITWSALSTNISVRYCNNGFIFDTKGQSLFTKNTEELHFYNALLNSLVASKFLQVLTPTLDFNSGYLRKIPDCSEIIVNKSNITNIEKKCIELAKNDWDQYETSWDFNCFQLLCSDFDKRTLNNTYYQYRSQGLEMTLEMQRLEEENNRIFIDAYSLQDELPNSVPLQEITLNCNPHFRYGNDKSELELEALLLADTMKEFISYAVGCMFGRYSLDKPGLILANQGETVQDYLGKVPGPTFEPDDDNVIPVLDEGWFIDDITERFRKFLKVTFGEEHYEENLAFLEEAIGKDIRKYFLKDFYSDHLKRYKKRPIYWLFSSPKGSFNALIYMHRYRPDTVSVVLNDYLREFRTKLSARKEHLDHVSISASASPKEKTQALKDLEKLRKIIDELDEYERETLYPLATKQIVIDLDDGVKVNYLKFGDALKKIPGLDAGEE